jgi:hypothetical protein
MDWCAISGSWRVYNEQVISDVTDAVLQELTKGNGIITGGALGVDYIATQTVLCAGMERHQLKLFLPIPLERFCAHYHQRAMEGVITFDYAMAVTEQLRKVKASAPDAVFDEHGLIKANEESYYARNTMIIDACVRLYAFQVNGSKGTQDAIDKAMARKKQAIIKRYIIGPEIGAA